jgi:hypothetical protein
MDNDYLKLQPSKKKSLSVISTGDAYGYLAVSLRISEQHLCMVDHEKQVLLPVSDVLIGWLFILRK